MTRTRFIENDSMLLWPLRTVEMIARWKMLVLAGTTKARRISAATALRIEPGLILQLMIQFLFSRNCLRIRFRGAQFRPR